MIVDLRSWIVTLVGTALVCSACLALTPECGAKKVLRLVCGFAMMAALIGIVQKFDAGALGMYMARYDRLGESAVEEALDGSSSQTRFIIEQECEAYILDKAGELGITLGAVEVTASWSSDGFWYPTGAVIKGDENTELARMIEAELGIPRSNQIWSTYDEN